MFSRVYMDYNATAPLNARAKDAMIQAVELCGNPSSVHQEGQALRRLINEARDSVAKLTGSEPAYIIFTSGATEAACHLLTPNYKMGRSPVKIAKLYMSAVEHPCIFSGGRFESDNVEVIGVDDNGCIDLSALEERLAAHPHDLGLPMLALQAVNNETGIVQPIVEALRIAKAHKAISAIDAVQAFGKMSFSMAEIQPDFAIISAHKIGGPKGVGAIISRGEILMPEALISGGGHEKGHRGGTENVSGIAGFGAASEAAIDNLVKKDDIQELRDYIEQNLRDIADDIVIHGAAVERIANTSCFALPGMKSETLQIAFDMEGIAASSGSACSSGKVGESHVLAAMGADAKAGAIRVSIGAETSKADCDVFLTAFRKINARRSERDKKGVVAA